MNAQSERASPPRVIQWIVVLIAVGFAVAYGVVAVSRIVYPYDLDFVEDGLLMQALRVANRQPAFVAPNADFVPHVYMLLYAWLGGQLLKITGPSLIPLRLISFTATLSIAGLIYWIARRERSSRALALVCACLFLAGYQIVGGWYELVKVDSLFVALTLAGVTATIYGWNSVGGLALAGLLLALSFLTKQNGLFYAALAGIYLLTVARQRTWIFATVFAAVALVPIVLVQTASNGWFGVYAFGILAANPMAWQRVVATVVGDLLGAMAVLSVMALITLACYLVTCFRQAGGSVVRFAKSLLTDQPWLLFMAAAIFSTVAGRASVGGNRNHLIQAYAFLCLAPALFMGSVSSWTKPSWRPVVVTVAWLALAAQFAFTLANPLQLLTGKMHREIFLPTRAMRESGDRFVERLEGLDGPVLVMMHPYYAILAGKAPGVHIQALWGARWRGRDPLPADLVARIENRYYTAIVSDESPYFETETELVRLMEANYVLDERLNDADAPLSPNGLAVRPRTIYVPK